MEELPRFNGAPTRGIGESAEWSNMHRLAQCAYHQQSRPPPSLNIDALQPLIDRIVQGPPTRHGGGRRQNQPFDFRRVIVRHPVVRASFLRRFLAEVIDSSLITLPVASFLMGLDATDSVFRADQSGVLMLSSLTSDLVAMLNSLENNLVQHVLIGYCLMLLYQTVCLWFTAGTTFGKFAVGIRVIEFESTRPPTLATSFVRAFVKVCTSLLCSFLFLFGLCEQHRRCIHDRLSGTMVVKAGG